VLTIIGPTVISLWLLVMGVLVGRRAARERSAPHERTPGARPDRDETREHKDDADDIYHLAVNGDDWDCWSSSSQNAASPKKR